MKNALFIGRFQPFHNAHLAVLKDILKKYDDVIIAIGSSQEKNTDENPFSYAQRKKMIELALNAEGIKNFRIYPVPDLYNDKKWTDYIKKKLPKFDMAFSGNEWVLRCFKKNKLKAKKIKLIKGISSTKIRKLMKEKKHWEHLVPGEVSDYIK